jgi:hypothetical protein
VERSRQVLVAASTLSPEARGTGGQGRRICVTAARQAGGAEQVLVAVTTLPPAQLEAKRSFFGVKAEVFF